MTQTNSTNQDRDLQAVFDALASAKPVDPEVARRVRERAQRVTQEIYEKHGLLNAAVDLVREVRDEG